MPIFESNGGLANGVGGALVQLTETTAVGRAVDIMSILVSILALVLTIVICSLLTSLVALLLGLLLCALKSLVTFVMGLFDSRGKQPYKFEGCIRWWWELITKKESMILQAATCAAPHIFGWLGISG